jgi:hypothetical protein
MQTPLLVTTTADAIPNVFAALPVARRSDAVYTSNGMLLRFLMQQRVIASTQVLLYLSGVPRFTLWPARSDGTIFKTSKYVICCL